MIEIKCPGSAAHIDVLLSRKIPEDYVPQVQWRLGCIGRAWCDFVSFDPRMPQHLQLAVVRVPRDEKAIAKLEADVVSSLSELDSLIATLSQLAEQMAA